MEELNTLRHKIELGGEVRLVVTSDSQGYKVVYSVVEFKYDFLLFRYFKCNKWQYSCDVKSKDINDCLEEVTKAFKEFYPEKIDLTKD